MSFPIFAKVDVNGPGADPIFDFLKREKPGWLGLKGIRWNFTKFLVDRAGKVVARYGPSTRPEELTAGIENLLGPA